MNDSTMRRWGRGWLAGAGLACLGTGFFLVEGCTSTTTVDLKSAFKHGPLFAKKGSATAPEAKKATASQQLASKNAPGRVRVSDLDEETAARLAERKPQPKAGSTKLTSATVRPPAKDRRENLDIVGAGSDVDDSVVSSPKETARSLTSTRRPSTVRNKPAKVVTDEFDPDLDDAASDFDEPPVSPSRGSKPAGKPVTTAKHRAAAKSQSVKPKSKSFDPELDIDEPSVTQVVDELDPAEDEAPTARRTTAQPKKADRSASAGKGTARAKEAPEAEKPAGSAHERRRADQLMQRAYAMYRGGYPEEALRLASVAVELEKSQQAAYRRGEERPSDFITWLQSGEAANIPAAPVITPQPRLDRQSSDPVDSDVEFAPADIESTSRRRPGKHLRAQIIPARSKPAEEPINTARSNAGASLNASEGPTFAGVSGTGQRAAANAGEVEVPLPPTPRSAEASAPAAVPEGPPADLALVAAVPQSPSITNVNHATETPKAGVTHLVMRPSAAVPPPADDVRDEAETIVETEISALAPVRSSQITIISLIGLIAGIAGMFGLSWWRVQESRHFATSK
jgi:hypothetical protein